MFPEISTEAARLDLNDLVKKKMLDKKGERKEAHYVIKQISQIYLKFHYGNYYALV